MDYRPRVIDSVLDELVPDAPALALEGAKGVGKTVTACRRATTALHLDNPQTASAVAADWDVIMQVAPPVLLDEWQLVPSVWDRVRRAVDEAPRGITRFFLTGSAMPAPQARIHSGAGRILPLTMRPMSIAERGLCEPLVSLESLLSDTGLPIAGSCDVGLMEYADEILASGFPGIRQLPERLRRGQLDGYTERIIDRDLPESGANVRNPAALRAWLVAYATASATNASYTSLLDAATSEMPNKPARQTVDQYREYLQRIFVLDPLPAWSPAKFSLKRLTVGPKHHLVDPALAARLTQITRTDLLTGAGGTSIEKPATVRPGPGLGQLFESLTTQSVRVYAQTFDGRVSHLRTKNSDHEIDLIVEDPDGRVVAIEVKIAGAITDRDVRHLNWLQDELGDRLADRLVITAGKHAYRRPDGVAVVPLALLGP